MGVIFRFICEDRLEKPPWSQTKQAGKLSLSWPIVNTAPTAPTAMSQPSTRKKAVFTALKLLLAIAVIGYLLFQIQKGDDFDRLLNDPKDWRYLTLGLLMILGAFASSFVRWYLLVRGLHMQFRLSDAFRLGSLGFMLNQVGPGSVGGDPIKAVFIAREQPDRKTEAVATVFIDRVAGFYGMLIIASLALACADYGTEPSKVILSIQTTVWSALAAGTVGLVVLLSPLATSTRVRQWAEAVPWIGSTLLRLIDALEIYHDRRNYLFGALVLALVTHSLLVSSFWCVSRGLPFEGPTFFQNSGIAPVAQVAASMPGFPGGLGALEGSLAFLYELIGFTQSEGAIVAFTYRVLTYVVAGMGAVYYLTSRKKMETMMHDAESLVEEVAS